MRGGTLSGRLRGLLILIAVLPVLGAAPSAARAADCNLVGSGPEGATDTTLYQAPGAQLDAAMIFVDFSDAPASLGETPPNIPGSIGPKLRDWAEDYLAEVSYNRTLLDIEMDDEWVTMSMPKASYNALSFQAQRDFIAEAVAKADAEGFDFSGKRTVYVVAAPTGGALPNSPAFHARASDAIVADGTAIRWGATLGDDIRLTHVGSDYGAKVLVHETGHTLGLPDLYRYGASGFDTAHLDAGAWDLMGWIGPGLHLTAWHKRKLGWLNSSEWTCVEGTVTARVSPVTNFTGTRMLATRASNSVAYVAEVREDIGHDGGMCDPGGVLIYRVDANAPGGAGPIQVKLAHPGAPGDASDPFCGALSNALFGDDPGDTSTFAEGAVTIDVLGGDPVQGYDIRMTGPVLPPDAGTGTSTAKPKCKKGRKLKKVKGKFKCVKKKKRKRR